MHWFVVKASIQTGEFALKLGSYLVFYVVFVEWVKKGSIFINAFECCFRDCLLIDSCHRLWWNVIVSITSEARRIFDRQSNTPASNLIPAITCVRLLSFTNCTAANMERSYFKCLHITTNAFFVFFPRWICVLHLLYRAVVYFCLRKSHCLSCWTSTEQQLTDFVRCESLLRCFHKNKMYGLVEMREKQC